MLQAPERGQLRAPPLLDPPDLLDPDVQTAFAVVFDHLAVSHEVEPAGAIFCFGSRDPDVPIRAAGLYFAGLAPFIVTTGGMPTDRGSSEAETIAHALMELGVPFEAVVSEHLSRHTGENAVEGLAALERAGVEAGSLLTVAWPFAARRGMATLRRHLPGLEVRSVPAHRRPGERTPLTARTCRWALAEATRLDRYARAGWIEPQPQPAGYGDAVETLAAGLDRSALRPALAGAPHR